MASGHINLRIGSSYDGGGFASAQKGVKSLGQSATRAAGFLGNLSSALGSTSQASRAAQAGITILGGALTGGAWGLAAAAIAAVTKGIVSLSTWFKKSAEDAKLAARGISKEFTTLEHATKGYQKRVEGYRKQKAERDRAAADEATRAQAAQEAALRTRKEEIKAEVELLKGERAVSEERERQNQIGKQGLEALKARHKLETLSAENNIANIKDSFRVTEGQAAGTSAWQRLKLAEEQLVTLRKKQQQEIADYLAAEKKAAEAAEKKAATDKKRTDLEAQIAQKEKRRADDTQRLEAQIKSLRLAAANLEKNAARARGKSYNEWQADEKANARAEKKAASQQAAREKNNAVQMRSLEERIFDRNGKLRKSANQQDVAQWQKRNEWRLNQNPGNNPLAKAADNLERQKTELLKTLGNDIATIRQQLSNVGL